MIEDREALALLGGGQRLVGVDEAGRGALAGPVLAGAVILGSGLPASSLEDSKQLSPTRRAALAALIQARAQAWAVGRAEVAEIDMLNILGASLLAMQRAVAALRIPPRMVVVDGRHCPHFLYPARALTGADRRLAAVAAASILAKVARDAELVSLDARYPEYGFARHKAYPVPRHLEALARHGPTPVHRQSFAPVARARERT